jgi:hypothetical protein
MSLDWHLDTHFRSSLKSSNQAMQPTADRPYADISLFYERDL